MAKVSELKERARILEQQGDLAKARTIYEHILKHLEGTPALKAELPMYVKVGDLSLKLGDPAGAVAMYEQAAEHYALAGSARSIGALTEKIRRADPTRDDAAVGLGQALLAHGHAGAAAEVAIRYARRVERDDVVAILSEIAPEASDPTSRARVQGALSLLAGPTPAEPEPEPEPEPAPEASAAEPEVAPPPPEPVAPEPVRWEEPAPAVDAEPPRWEEPQPSQQTEPVRWEEPESEREPESEAEEAAARRLDLPLLSFAPDAPAAEPAAPTSESDGLLIRHGVEEPGLAAAPPSLPVPEPEIAAAPPREPEPAAAPEVRAPPKSIDEVIAEATAAAKAAAEVAEERAPEPRLEPEPEVEPEYATAPEPALVPEAAAPPTAPEPPVRPSRPRGLPDESHVLVRELRPAKKEGNRGLIAAGVGLAVIVAGGAAAWALGLLPFGRGEGNAGGGQPPEQPVVAESLAAPVDSVEPTDSAATPADTTQFGPIGFNAVTNPPAADTVPPPVAPPPVVVTTPQPAPAQPAAALPPVVVPPGHAIANEIVVIPGLEVVSVSETRAGGAPGIRVIQRADDGEIALVATPADFGADTVGNGEVAIRVEGDTQIGDVRVGRYLVEARSTLPSDVLFGLLGRLIRARPVN